MPENKKINILDCTLRDGSYVVDYQFTTEDTETIGLGLERAGVRHIEIGHGLGFNGSQRHGAAAASDREYLEAARRSLKKARYGMFYIPGIGRLDDLRMAADLGMGFVRVGTNVTEAAQAAEAISLAKKLGLHVSANLMKSYAVPPEEAAAAGKVAEDLGADVVAVVDSAGGMFPDEVKLYVEAMKAALTKAEVGIHAHNNLQMAIINSVSAAEAGATWIDACLQGLGRSAGNASTEILALIFHKRGFSTSLDPYRLMDLGERLISPILQRVERTSGVDITSGIALFHSSFLKTVTRMADRYGVDARDVINGVGEFDRVNVSEELAESVAKKLSAAGRTTAQRDAAAMALPKAVEPAPPKTPAEAAKRLAAQLKSTSGKARKPSVFTVARSRRAGAKTRFPYLRENASAVIGNLEYASERDALAVLQALDGAVDLFLIDAGPNGYDRLRGVLKKSRALPYSDDLALARAALGLCLKLADSPENSPVLLLGISGAGHQLAELLTAHRFPISLWDEDAELAQATADMLARVQPGARIVVCKDPRGAAFIVGASGKPDITAKLLKTAPKGCRVLDAVLGSLAADAAKEGLERGLPLYRLDMRAGLSGEVTSVLDTEELVGRVLGRRSLAGVSVVAGGVLGRKGEVVVDSISKPLQVLGTADGRGGLLAKDPPAAAKVRRELLRLKLV